MQIHLDSLQYRAAVSRLITEKRADARKLLDEEGRLLIRDIIKLTPPHSKQEGERSVERNLLRAFAPIDPQKLEQEGPLGVRMAKLARHRDVGALNAIFSRLIKGPFRGKTIMAANEMPATHQRLMNAKGRVSRARYPVFLADFRAYLKLVKARVGWAKAGWLAAAQKVGLALPSYVTRHGQGKGSAFRLPAPRLGITFINFSTKIPNYQAKVDFAVKARYNSLVREAKRILAGGKSRRGSFAGTPTGGAGP